MASNEELTELGKSIENSVQDSIEAGVQAVILPPDTKKLIQEISQSFDSQDIRKIEMALVKLEKITTALGLDLGSYNKKLGDTVAKYEQEKRIADVKIAELKEKGIIAVTDTVERNGQQFIEAVILSKTQIREQEKDIKKKIITLEIDEKEFKKELKLERSSEKITKKESRELIAKQDKLTDRRNQLTKQQENLAETDKAQTGGEGEDGMYALPDFIAGPLQELGSFLMTPIAMFQQLSDMIGGVIKGFVDMGKFIFGNFVKIIKKLVISFKALNLGVILSAMLILGKFILLGIVIGAFLVFAKKFIWPVLKWMGQWLGKILQPILIKVGQGLRWLWDGLKALTDWLRNSWLGRKLKLDDESVEKKEKDAGEKRIHALNARTSLGQDEQEELAELQEKWRDKAKVDDMPADAFLPGDEVPETGEIPDDPIGAALKQAIPLIERQKNIEKIKREGALLTTPVGAFGGATLIAPTTNLNTKQGDVFTIPNILVNQEESFNRAAGQDV